MYMCVHEFTITILAVADEHTIILHLLSLSEYTVPSFVGNSYFCATGSRDSPGNTVLYNNPLWDGVGYTGSNTCCQFNQPPWFCRTLPTATSDDLEVRIL